MAGAMMRVPTLGAALPLESLIETVAPVAEGARLDALRRHDELVKPPGSLGALESLAGQLAAIAAGPPPVPGAPWLLLAAADHGVHAEGVSAWPQEVTAAIVDVACRGESVSAVLADTSNVAITVLDVGLVHDTTTLEGLLRHPVRAGTRNLAIEDAMTADEVRAAIKLGAAVVNGMIDEGADLVLLGEMGIGNTTASACLIAALTSARAVDVTGRGANADDAVLSQKIRVVQAAAQRCAGRPPLQILAAVGGFEHAALVGAILASAGRRVPVLLDGMITNAAAVVAAALQPNVGGYLIASHQSTEPGAAVALNKLGLEPLLDLGLRLGEGSGALLATPLVINAAAVLARTALLSDIQADAST